MQEYEEPTQTVITSSVSMYGRIRAWLLHGHDELPPELIRGNLVNQKVNDFICYYHFFFDSEVEVRSCDVIVMAVLYMCNGAFSRS